MSSRNAYLSSQQRQDAVALSQSMRDAINDIQPGKTAAKDVIQHITTRIEQVDGATIDYINIVNTQMQDVDTIHKGDILALAVYIGTTRLIDNHIIGEPLTF